MNFDSQTSKRNAFRGLVVAFGVSAVGFGTMAPFLVLWGHRDAGLSGAVAGLLFIAQAAGEVTGGLGGGLLADRFGGRQVLLGSTVGMALAYGSLALVGAPGVAIAVLFLAGLFEAAYHPTAFALVSDLKPEDERAHAYGVIRAAGNVGTILGPLAGAAVVAGASVADVFIAAGALLAASGVVLVATLPRRGAPVHLEEEAEELAEAASGLAAIARDRRLGLLVLGGGLLTITLAWWEVDGLVVIAGQRPFGTASFSILLALSAALTVAFQVPITRVTRAVPVGRLLAGGAVVQALGLALFAAASASLAFVVAGVVLIEFGQMLYSPNTNALVSRIAPRGRGATYQAAISTTADIGMAVGPASGLGLSASIGARLMWLLALPLGGLAAGAYRRAAREAPAPDRPSPSQEEVKVGSAG
jgi:MFS family permease